MTGLNAISGIALAPAEAGTADVLKLLVIEDNKGDARLLQEMLKHQGAPPTQLIHVTSMLQAEANLGKFNADLILLDLGLPDAQGLAAVRRVRAAAQTVPLIVLTGLDDERLAVQALAEGAKDYLIKDEITPRSLARALRYAIQRELIEEAVHREIERGHNRSERLETTLQSIGDAVVCADDSGRVTFSNAVADEMAGFGETAPANLPAREIIRMLAAACDTNPKKNGADGGEKIRHLPSNYTMRRRDGQEIAVEGCITKINPGSGEAAGNVIVFRDVSQARAAASRAQHSANHDFLTGLPNRMLLEDRITQAIAMAPRRGKIVAVFFLDLDGFKAINDSLGHAVGDELLKSVAARLVKCVRGSDTVSRQGGDEFVVLLTEMGETEGAAITAQRMLSSIAEAHSIGGHQLFVSVSIGISVYPDDGADAARLIKNADAAMYKTKQSGRNCFQFCRPAEKLHAGEGQIGEETLRDALKRGEFSLVYQPRVNITTGAITGAEALIRWTHPLRGLIFPAQFIPLAESCELIKPMGDWVLREACRQAGAWRDAGLPPVTMSVNASAIEIRGHNFVESLREIIEDARIPPEHFELDLSQRVLINCSAPTAESLRKLRAQGIRLAVDDFGTGYASLSSITKYNIDTIKIDRSLISQIGKSDSDAAIVTGSIGLARSLNITVVAEGVESREQANFLIAHNCVEGQGYYFSRPVAAAAFTRLLRAPATVSAEV
jgi:diguanylate cyclase (GGDEF)-like protein/PAS domain S-box-containing protein